MNLIQQDEFMSAVSTLQNMCRPSFAELGFSSNDNIRYSQIANWANIRDMIQILASEGVALISQVNSKFDVLRWKDIIDNSSSLDEFNIGVQQLRDRWQIEPSLLPDLPTSG